MPKNKIGGKKHKKGKNSVETTNLRLKEENQEYAKVISLLGNCRFKVQCSDGIERIGILRGNMKKKKFVNKDNIVLIEKWEDLQINKCSIIDVYKEEHVKKLKKMKEIPDIFTESTELIEDYNPFDMGDDTNINDNIESEESDDDEDIDNGGIDLDEI